jgi:hypothetical protein
MVIVVLTLNAALMVVILVESVPLLFNRNVGPLDTVECVVWMKLLLKHCSPMEILLYQLMTLLNYLKLATDVLRMLTVLLMELIAFGPTLLMNV